MDFIFYDLIFLVLFGLIVGLFLYKNRKKLQIEGKVMLLYRTNFGLNFIEKASKKSPTFFRILAVVSIMCGYILMIGGILLIIDIVWLLWASEIVINVPPLMPLIPYLPSLFNIPSLPFFYFTYWIVSIAIVAISHEFMHGVFARFYGIKLKSTGFGFLGPFLAAFVELDEKKMDKKPVNEQLAVLSGGSFANLIMSILFVLVIVVFFSLAFAQAGVTMPYVNAGGMMPNYNYNIVNVSDVTYQGDAVNLTQLSLENKTEYKIDGEKESYFLTKGLLSIIPKNSTRLIVYSDTSAHHLRINGTIQSIDGKKTNSYEEFREILGNKKPGDNISIEISERDYNLTLVPDLKDSSKASIGLDFNVKEGGTILELLRKLITKEEGFTLYKSSALSVFILSLFLWIILINISVMLMNMLPFTIFDGGRFFYLSLVGLTGSKKMAVKGFKIANTFILLVFIAMMAIWAIRYF